MAQAEIFWAVNFVNEHLVITIISICYFKVTFIIHG